MENSCEPSWSRPLFTANMLRDPLKDLPETELSSCNGLNYELMGRKRLQFEVASVDQQKSVSNGECDALVVSNLWTENGRFEEAFVSDSMSAAIIVDQPEMNLQNFAYG